MTLLFAGSSPAIPTNEGENMYDFLIVGAGLFGSVFAHQAQLRGKKCLVIDKRPHVGGNCYTEKVNGIDVHLYGAHIFRTDNEHIWKYINSFAEFLPFINSPIAIKDGRVYNMPFNMNTFAQMFGVSTPLEAMLAIEKDKEHFPTPRNLEEKVLDMVGRKIYEELVKEYTEKQWGCSCRELPPSIINALPLRFVYDNNYFNDRWQGIPKGGYTQIFDKMLDGTEVHLKTEYEPQFARLAATVVHTGMIDKHYGMVYGGLEYRALRWEHSLYRCSNYQGNAVVNYTGSSPMYTRSIEHKHFVKDQLSNPITIVSREYPELYDGTNEAFYPIPTEKNISLYKMYIERSRRDNIAFAGWCGGYSDNNMSQTIINAWTLADSLCN